MKGQTGWQEGYVGDIYLEKYGANIPLDVDLQFHTPIRIKPTKQYNARKAKFTKWLELSGYNQDG